MKLPYLSIVAAALIIVPACEQKPVHTPNSKDGIKDAFDNRPNEEVRDAVEDAGDAVRDAGRETKDAIKEAGEDLKDAGKRLKDAGKDLSNSANE